VPAVHTRGTGSGWAWRDMEMDVQQVQLGFRATGCSLVDIDHNYKTRLRGRTYVGRWCGRC